VSHPDEVRDAGYDEWLDAVAAGEGTYLACPEGHGSLPPRRTCPRCGSTDLAETPLPERGELSTYTVVHVPGPRFAEDAPYVTAIASFGPVRVTGVLRGVADGDGGIDDDRFEVGTAVEIDVEDRGADRERAVAFRPV